MEVPVTLLRSLSSHAQALLARLPPPPASDHRARDLHRLLCKDLRSLQSRLPRASESSEAKPSK